MENKKEIKNKMNANDKVLDNSDWVELYEKFRVQLVNGLSHYYCFADREDAVEFAFDKLMHRKDAAAYGDRFPQTEKDWLSHLHWQARSYLSRIKDRADRHAKYVESMSKELEGAFAPGLQGIFLDAKTRTEALVEALEIFRAEQDVSRRDFNVYLCRIHGIPSKEIARNLCGVTANNVDQIKYRVGLLLQKYGPDCYVRALRRVA